MSFSIALTGCSDDDHPNHPANSHEDHHNSPTKSYNLLLASTYGGENKVGSMQEFDSQTLSPKGEAFELEGAHFSGANVDAHESGFVWNPADEKFYGVILNASLNEGELLVSFDPVTDKLTLLKDISGAAQIGGFQLSGYRQPPVLTADGKGLIAVAQDGGPKSNCPVASQFCGRPGALVHINIDLASNNYLSLSPLYSFQNFGTSTTDGLHNVNTRPVLFNSNGAQGVFLIAEGIGWTINGVTTNVRGQPFALSPSDIADWSKPWQSVGTFAPLSDENLTELVSHDPIYIESRDLFVWASNPAGDEFFVDHQIGLNGASAGTMILNHNFTGCYRPSGFVNPLGSVNFKLFCGGLDQLNDLSSDNKAGEILEISPSFSDSGVIRTFSNWPYDDAAFSRLHPYGYSQASNSSIFINASVQYPDQWFSDSSGLGFLPSEVAEYNSIDTSLVTVFKGSEEEGLAFIGRPAFGGGISEPINDRYLVQLARFGGEYGQGSLIKYDRLDDTKTVIPLGFKNFGVPTGKPHQLENGNILASADFYNSPTAAGFIDNYRASSYLLTSTGNIEENPILEKLVVNNIGTESINFKYSGTPLVIAEADNGELWSSVYYNLPFRQNFSGQLTGLLKFNAQSGANETVLMLTEADGGDGGSNTQVAALGNKLFVTGVKAFVGEQGWCIDLEMDDGTGKPQFMNTSLAGNLFSEPDLSRAVVHGATAMDNTLYVMTAPRNINGGSDARIHQINLDNCTSTGPTYSQVLAGLNDIPSTRLLAASDGNLYYGTENGKLIAFNPNNNSVTEVADLSAIDATSEVAGYLTETHLGDIVGILFDSKPNGEALSQRAFIYNLSSLTATTSDISNHISPLDPFPGFVEVTR